MVDGFDVVAVRVEDEGRVVTGMIGTLSGSAVILATIGQRRLVERFDGRAARCLERDMVAARQVACRGGTVRRRDAEFVCPEKSLARPADRNVQCLKNSAVKLL